MRPPHNNRERMEWRQKRGQGNIGEFRGKQWCQNEELHQITKDGIETQGAPCPRCCNVLSAGHLHYVVLCINLLHSLTTHIHTHSDTHCPLSILSISHSHVIGDRFHNRGEGRILCLPLSPCYTQPKTSINRKTHKYPTVRGWGQVCSSSSIIPKDSWDEAVVPQLCDSASVKRCQASKSSLFLFCSVPPPTPCSVSLSSSSLIHCCRKKEAVKRSHSELFPGNWALIQPVDALQISKLQRYWITIQTIVVCLGHSVRL